MNRSAAAARVAAAATDPRWRLVVAGPRPVELTLAQLGALPQYEADLPIACVEGWSATHAGAGCGCGTCSTWPASPPGRHLILVSLEHGGYQTAPVGPNEARDPLSLLALRVGGEPLALDHGYPLRFIGPNRPGVQQTKWLSRIELA